ncbi:YgaP family membrane protein [Sphingomonas arenae]|nr:DUF2892 domain-containing protein [Sphingomonas arenae]
MPSLSLVFIGHKTSLGYLDLIPLVTGLVGYCPVYRLLRLNTGPLKR